MSFVSRLYDTVTTPVGPDIAGFKPLDNPGTRIGKFIGTETGNYVRTHPEQVKRAAANSLHNIGTVGRVGLVATNPALAAAHLLGVLRF